MTKPKPTIPEVLPLVKALYASDHGRGCGGCLHIVLDDGNVDNHSVLFSRDLARTNKCAPCEHLANLLLRMSKTQRLKLGRLAYD